MMVCFSAIIHLVVYFFLLEFHFPAHFKEAPVYYVDVLDLPVANPQAGTPGGAPNEPKTAPAPPAPAPPAPREMTLPAKPTPKKPTAAPPKKADEAETPEEFDKRMKALEQKAADRRMNETLAKLRQNVAKGPVGMPGATGTQAGSDYASYIKARLQDEFTSTISYQSKRPEVYVNLVISPAGRIVRQHIVKSTKDKIFEDSVYRSIVKAERNFRPPPSGNQFEITVKFSPQGIGKQ